jgi:radical SAM protein with 4Fe4S-binding SPASM domain
MDDHKKVSSKIVDFAQKCDRLDIRLGFDCGFTLCSFSNKQLGRLIRYNSALSMACTPTVDVAPDLAVWRCFPTSLLWNRRLTDFGNINEVLNFFNKKFSLFHRVGAREECLRCKYLRRRQCAGGCLGHTLKAFNLGERIKYIDTG